MVILEFLTPFKPKSFNLISRLYNNEMDLQTDFKSKIADVVLEPSNIIFVLEKAMEAVELTTMKNNEKKHAATKLVSDLVAAAPIDENTRQALKEMIELGVISNAIDIIVAASKGNLALNSVVSVTQAMISVPKWNCFRSLFKSKPFRKK